MLFTIDKSLELGMGEYRLIGFTDDQLSRNELSPKATQLQNKTIVLVHLRRPDFRKPEPDKDHWVDLLKDTQWENEQGEDFELPDEFLNDSE